MKRIVALLLSLIVAFSSVACGSSGESKVETADKNVSVENKIDKNDIYIAEVVLMDEASIKVTATGIDMDAFMGPEIKVLIENNSETSKTIQVRDVSVNGFMVDTIFSSDVAAGKKANDTITLMSSDLKHCGIEAITDIELSFHIYETDSWTDILDTQPIQIRTSIFDSYQYSYIPSGDVAYEGNDIKIVIENMDEESIFGKEVVVYIENNSNKGVTVQTRDVSINGFMVDPIFSSEIAVGKKAVDTITFMESDLENNAIEKIETIELSFHIYDSNNWNTITDTEIITLTLE